MEMNRFADIAYAAQYSFYNAHTMMYIIINTQIYDYEFSARVQSLEDVIIILLLLFQTLCSYLIERLRLVSKKKNHIVNPVFFRRRQN